MTVTDQQIRSFLARVGEAASPAPDFDQLTRRAERPPSMARRRSPRVVAAVAAGLLVIVGVVGLASIARESEPASEPTVPALPADPPGPLFVLPVDLDTYTVSAGTVSVLDPAADLPAGSYQWALMGTSVHDGFEDLVGVMSLGPDARVDGLLAVGDWDEIDTPTGPANAIHSPAGGIGIIVQQRGSQWLRLTKPDADATDLVPLLSEIEISDTGAISTNSTTPTVFAHGTETVTAIGTIGFTATGPGGSFLIETAPLSSPLAALGTVGDRAEHIAIDDRTGWLISQRTEQGLTPHALIWSATPRRTITIGTNSDQPTHVADLVQLAEQLQIVDESTWRAALPDATTETITPL